jgi:hypothetical protein
LTETQWSPCRSTALRQVLCEDFEMGHVVRSNLEILFRRTKLRTSACPTPLRDDGAAERFGIRQQLPFLSARIIADSLDSPASTFSTHLVCFHICEAAAQASEIRATVLRIALG